MVIFLALVELGLAATLLAGGHAEAGGVALTFGLWMLQRQMRR